MPFVLLCVGLRSMKIRWNWVKFLNSGMTKWRRKTDLGPASLVKVRINPLHCFYVENNEWYRYLNKKLWGVWNKLRLKVLTGEFQKEQNNETRFLQTPNYWIKALLSCLKWRKMKRKDDSKFGELWTNLWNSE